MGGVFFVERDGLGCPGVLREVVVWTAGVVGVRVSAVGGWKVKTEDYM
jgi:hypothetical protein